MASEVIIGQVEEVMVEEIGAKKFKQFDTVTNYSDHKYGGSTPNYSDDFSNASNDVRKKIVQEWKLLEEHLPDSIYVRVFEERIDLLRAVIIGVPGTPYHDGLFFFDLKFPPNYPNQPPNVTFHSHGLRINPNLYNNGYVCLSLLNTWQGQGKEMWDPSESTILQVLLSLQALVLNEEPYYNEPGYDKQQAYNKASERYTNDAFVKSCKIMQYLLKNPPKNFEEFVVDHFRERAKNILGACKRYGEGDFKVGFYKDDGDGGEKVNVLKGFKGLMESTYRDLDKAFKDYIEGYSQEQDIEVEELGDQSIGSKRKNTVVNDNETKKVTIENGTQELEN